MDELIDEVLRAPLFVRRWHMEWRLVEVVSGPARFALTNSDWGTHKATSGWVVLWCSAAISWGLKRQPTIIVVLLGRDHGSLDDCARGRSQSPAS